MRRWKILNKLKVENGKLKIDEIIKALFINRGLKNKKDIEEFLNPKLSHVTVSHVAINLQQLKKAVSRIQKAIKNKEQIVVYGDYDVDGICGSAIIWETLYGLGAKIIPYIPHRVDEGYGLSVKGVNNVILNSFQDLREMPKRVRHDKKRGLIITVDNGIVASQAVDFANKQGIDVIVTDHHVPGKKLPKAHAIVHTTKLCGAGVAWALSQAIENRKLKIEGSNGKWKMENGKLELVALATIADLVPLIGANRTLTKYGLAALQKTQRVGLLELFKEAALNPQNIDTYQIGHIIAPRLNATGRITHAMDSLRLLCTKDRVRARLLAEKLGKTNRERQQVTEETTLHARSTLRPRSGQAVNKLIFISHESYQQGVIGLVAGKLVEEFYRPAIVVSKGEKYSKASARSVSGFNIVEFIRTASELLVDVGGHPMAAGFTVETAKLSILEEKLTRLAEKQLDKDKLVRTLHIDCEINLDVVSPELYKRIQELAPFGMANPQPTFVSRKVVIEDMRVVGNGGKHLKLWLGMFDAIAFGMGERAVEFHVGDKVNIVYTIEQDSWNGDDRLQLKIKDIQR